MQSKQNVQLTEVDSVEITSVVDNSIDFISPVNLKQVQNFWQWTKEQYGPDWQNTHTQLPIAEHGFSMLIKVFSGKKSKVILFDTGGSSDVIAENVKRMGLSINEVDCIVLSHGHYDHFGGLASVVKLVGKEDLPVIVHEDMFKIRGTVSPQGALKKYIKFPSQVQLNAQYVGVSGSGVGVGLVSVGLRTPEYTMPAAAITIKLQLQLQTRLVFSFVYT